MLSQTTQSAIGLCVDNVTNTTTYSCVIIDNQGCSDTIYATIIQAEKLEVIDDNT